MSHSYTPKEHDDLALRFIELEQSFRGLPNLKVLELAREILAAANSRYDSSDDVIITTPAGSDSTLHATAIDRALRAQGVTTHSSRFANSDVLTDIVNQAIRDPKSIEALFHQPVHDIVEFTVPKTSLPSNSPAPQALIPK